jgi:polyisoprenoid-binding protein YceI
MQAQPGPVTAPPLQALLEDGALAGEWVLDPSRSSIGLENRSMRGLDGAVNGTLTVAAASVDTKNTRRDSHLRSADFFDSGRHPDIIFTADSILPCGPGVTVTGVLTVRDRTRPLSFEAAASVPGDGEIWLDAEVGVNRADFGLTWNLLGTVSMRNTVTIHAVFTRQTG